MFNFKKKKNIPRTALPRSCGGVGVVTYAVTSGFIKFGDFFICINGRRTTNRRFHEQRFYRIYVHISYIKMHALYPPKSQREFTSRLERSYL